MATAKRGRPVISGQETEPPKTIVLKKVPLDIWRVIKETKMEILKANPNRMNVSHGDAIYKVMRKRCKEEQE